MLMVLSLSKLRCNQCSERAFKKIRKIFHNNFYIRYNLETYVVYSVCYLMNMKDFSLKNWAVALQSTVGALHLLLLFGLPFIVIFFYNWHYAKLVSNKQFKAKWGSLYLGLVGTDDTSNSTLAYKYPACQLLRKFFFCFFVVAYYNQWIFQVASLFLSTTFMVWIVSFYGPYQSNKLNRLQIIFDMAIIILSDLMIAFNGGGWLSENQNVRFSIGWGYIGVFGLCLLISVVVLVVITLKAVQRTLLMTEVKRTKKQAIMAKRKRKSVKQ